MAAAGREPSVFAAELDDTTDRAALHEGVAGAYLSVISGAAGQAACRQGIDDLGGRLVDWDLTPEFTGRYRTHLNQPPATAVAILRGASPPAIGPAPEGFKVTALIVAYNEEDVIEATIRHLADNGVDVYLIDNWSTDSTLDRALGLAGVELAGYEHFPPNHPSHSYEWVRLLTRVEEVASTLDADWVLSNDADEYRYAPWAGVSLRDGLYHVDRQGYTAVNHACLNFELTEEGLEWFRPELLDMHRVNCWHRDPGAPGELAWSGGHDVLFAGRAVFPYNFLLKHFPIRSVEQGQRKIFQERLPRYAIEERLQGWHSHYDHISPADLIKSTEGLFHFGPTFDEDFLIERLTGVGLDPPSVRVTPKIRVARVLRRLGLLDRALSLRWRTSGRAAKNK
jgi:hypothetical protein